MFLQGTMILVLENGQNVHREYLQFEKGYKVTSGVCESSSNASSISPPQGQQIP